MILMAAIRKQDKQTSRSVPIMVQAQSRKTGCLRRRVTPNVTSCLRNGTILVFISENSTGSAPLGQLKITGLFRAYSIYKRIQDGYFPQEPRGIFVTQHTNMCFFPLLQTFVEVTITWDLSFKAPWNGNGTLEMSQPPRSVSFSPSGRRLDALESPETAHQWLWVP